MVTKEIYPKTPRLSSNPEYQITEKIDGSNLCIGKVILKGEPIIFVATRGIIYNGATEADCINKNYPKLRGWIKEHYDFFMQELHEGSVLFLEWTGQGGHNVKYDHHGAWYYGKGRVKSIEINSLNDISLDPSYSTYSIPLLIYPFISQEIPDFLRIPWFINTCTLPDKAYLDNLFNEVNDEIHALTKIEGFVVWDGHRISKYVRRKNGKLVEYSDLDRKGE